jgi:hypothetical protein
VCFFTRPLQFGAVAFSGLLHESEEAMTQNELNRAVARATGESMAVISGMGFVPLTSVPCERETKSIDWDQLDQSRRVSLQRRRKRTPRVA